MRGPRALPDQPSYPPTMPSSPSTPPGVRGEYRAPSTSPYARPGPHGPPPDPTRTASADAGASDMHHIMQEYYAGHPPLDVDATYTTDPLMGAMHSDEWLEPLTDKYGRPSGSDTR